MSYSLLDTCYLSLATDCRNPQKILATSVIYATIRLLNIVELVTTIKQVNIHLVNRSRRRIG